MKLAALDSNVTVSHYSDAQKGLKSSRFSQQEMGTISPVRDNENIRAHKRRKSSRSRTPPRDRKERDKKHHSSKRSRSRDHRDRSTSTKDKRKKISRSPDRKKSDRSYKTNISTETKREDQSATVLN